MKPYARYCLYSVIVLQIILYGIWYLTSPRGLHGIVQSKKEIAQYKEGIYENNRKLVQLKQVLQDWQDYPLYHEQQARALQYVFPGDEVYIAPKSHQ
jgi:hypothetical protein